MLAVVGDAAPHIVGVFGSPAWWDLAQVRARIGNLASDFPGAIVAADGSGRTEKAAQRYAASFGLGVLLCPVRLWPEVDGSIVDAVIAHAAHLLVFWSGDHATQARASAAWRRGIRVEVVTVETPRFLIPNKIS